jgi:hypothetical protein
MPVQVKPKMKDLLLQDSRPSARHFYWLDWLRFALKPEIATMKLTGYTNASKHQSLKPANAIAHHSSLTYCFL